MRNDYPHYLAVPFRIGADGRTDRPSGLEQHVRDELKQLILTNLGERPFLPEFGTNVRRLLFENIDETAKAMTKATVTQAINRWLGHRVTLENLNVTSEEGTLTVDVQYRLAGTEDSRTLRFQRSEV
jgi:phage baseplate assembly protein W